MWQYVTIAGQLYGSDAEEYGLMGSTEFAEQHAAALQVEAVAYLNVDELNGANPAAKATPSAGVALGRHCLPMGHHADSPSMKTHTHSHIHIHTQCTQAQLCARAHT